MNLQNQMTKVGQREGEVQSTSQTTRQTKRKTLTNSS